MAVGNKRQRLAKKAYLEKNEPQPAASEGGGLPPSSNAPREDSKTDSTTSKNKRKSGETRKPPTHPLRVPGMRPGEACFLCKGTGHIAKNCPQKEGNDRKKMCLSCRCWGHTLKTCPSAPLGKSCYNCGQDGHRLSDCPEPRVDDGAAHAVCFVCRLKGHLSRNCPSNPNGCYPKGGCCKLCGGVTHLAKDCVTPRGGGGGGGGGGGRGGGGAKLRTICMYTSTLPQVWNEVWDAQASAEVVAAWEAAPVSAPGSAKGRIIFESGDDLEDDFERSEGPGERSGGTREEGGRDPSEPRDVTDARDSEREMVSTDSQPMLTKARSIRF